MSCGIRYVVKSIPCGKRYLLVFQQRAQTDKMYIDMCRNTPTFLSLEYTHTAVVNFDEIP